MKRFCLAWAVVGVLAVASSSAVAADAVAINNATVQPAGPRSGSNGKAFFNIEGREVPGFADFASFGVLEFDASDLGLGTVSQVTSVKVTLVQALATFTSRGRMKFFVTEDNTTSIEPSSSPQVVFDLTDVHGIGNQLQPIHDLSIGEFVPVRSSWIQTYTFSITSGSALETYLKAQINSGNNIRIVVAPEFSVQDSELTAGTYGGYTNSNGYVPLLTVTAN